MLIILVSVATAAIMAPLAIAFILTVMVYAGWPVSGAHYNPAVTLAVWVKKRIKLKDIPGYIIAQLAAVYSASFISIYLVGETERQYVDPLVAPIPEFLGTFALVFVILNVAISEKSKGNAYYGLAIGLTVGALAYAFGPLSGGALNPAVTLGAMDAGLLSPDLWWKYFLAQFTGSLLAVAVFSFTDRE